MTWSKVEIRGLCGVLYAEPGGRGFVSRDGGEHFTHEAPRFPEGRRRFELIPGTGPVLARMSTGLHRWEGGAWVRVGASEGWGFPGLLWSFRAAIFGVAEGRLHRSLDGGVTFHPLALEVPTFHEAWYGFRRTTVSADDNDRVLVVAPPDFIARSQDNGETWARDALPKSAAGQPIRAGLIAHGHEWIATQDDNWGTLWTTGPKPVAFPPDLTLHVAKHDHGGR